MKQTIRSASKRPRVLAKPDEAAEVLFQRVAAILEEARASVVRAVNSRMVMAYWLIGREIVRNLQGGAGRATYGTAVIRELSKRLTARYGDGFSLSSLKDYRLFYAMYADREAAMLASQASPGIIQIGHPAGGQSGTFLAGQKSHPAGGQFGMKNPFRQKRVACATRFVFSLP